MSIQCLIVDDEFIARKLLSDYVNRVPELELVATCSTALEAMSYIKDDTIDILFLDIHMPDITGLDFLKTLPNRPQTVLTTAYTEYAVISYEMDVADYLLKPIEFDRFYKAVIKIIGREKQIELKPPVAVNETQKPDKLFIKSDKKIIKVDVKSISFIKGQGPYVQVFTTDGQKILTLLSMSKLEELLPANFYRTHRSYIVNTDLIDSIEGNLIHIGEHDIVLSKNKRDEFIGLIDQPRLLGY
ncbi:MAG: LytTR family DNA-binding domain-containing protein [Bacteroidota bacterium]